ncbi:MAG: C40 family peptidase [Leptospiraceae bacterium]|nr:C40 family peptidase [Leptospiraceae bacterium]MCK6381012.1 C40 family peptidase [Leptospiraceae bacterium]NUM41410.1 C40 family peptidase [Leptospiraceae bacterium]
MKFLSILFLFISLSIHAKTMEELLKEDWTGQETLLIKNEVKKRLALSFEPGSEHLANITKKIIPWAMMEGLQPIEVARIIVYMDRAVKAGADFEVAEDLIPLVATKDISIKDFIMMVEYYKETSKAKIPEQIRQLFLTTALQKKWDGFSILSAGRGLILAKSSGMDLNTVAPKLLKAIPPNGFKKNPKAIEAEIKKAIQFNPNTQRVSNSNKIFTNLRVIHEKSDFNENNIEEMKTTIKEIEKTNTVIEEISELEIIPRKTVEKKFPEPEFIPNFIDEEEAPKILEEDKSPKESWETLKESNLKATIKPWVGTPYLWGGSSKRGIDCSGFTGAILTDKNIGAPKALLPHSSGSQAKSGSPVEKSMLRAGDLIFFSASPNGSKITHVGVVISNKEFAHSSNKGVGYDPIDSKHWSKRFVKARRIFKKVIN